MLSSDVLYYFDRFVVGIGEAVSYFPDDLQFCSLEALTEPTAPVFCIIRAGVSNQSKNEFLDYGKMCLQRETFSSQDLPKRLTEFNLTGKMSSAHGEIVFTARYNNPVHQRFYASQSPYHSWPGCLYELGGTSQFNSASQEPLVGKGLPPFFNLKDAITNWIHVPFGDSDAKYGKLLLFVPDFTARLGEITFVDSVLSVSAAFSITTLSISVLATDGHTTFRQTEPLQTIQTFKLMPNPTSLSIFITDDKGEIVDSFAEEQAWTTRERVIFAGARYSEGLMELLRRGESDSVEFKEFIRLDDKKKAAELVKATISFANTRGGSIFIGIADDGEIVGVEAHIPHDERKAATFESDYFTGVRTLLQQNLNRIPPIDMRSERIGDKTLFVLKVEEGAAKPYTNFQTRETFIRRGASDMRPDPDTELRQMMGNSPVSFWNP